MGERGETPDMPLRAQAEPPVDIRVTSIEGNDITFAFEGQTRRGQLADDSVAAMLRERLPGSPSGIHIQVPGSMRAEFL